MQDDSGAFKTNPPNSGPFERFVMTPGRRCSEDSPAGETFSGPEQPAAAPIFNQRRQAVAVSSNQPDSLRAFVCRVANAANFSSHRVPDGSRAFAETLRRRNPLLHAARLPFSVRCDRVVDVG